MAFVGKHETAGAWKTQRRPPALLAGESAAQARTCLRARQPAASCFQTEPRSANGPPPASGAPELLSPLRSSPFPQFPPSGVLCLRLCRLLGGGQRGSGPSAKVKAARERGRGRGGLGAEGSPRGRGRVRPNDKSGHAVARGRASSVGTKGRETRAGPDPEHPAVVAMATESGPRPPSPARPARGRWGREGPTLRAALPGPTRSSSLSLPPSLRPRPPAGARD